MLTFILCSYNRIATLFFLIPNPKSKVVIAIMHEKVNNSYAKQYNVSLFTT